MAEPDEQAGSTSISRCSVGTEAGAAGVYGPVEEKVRADIGSLVTAHPMGEALAELAYSLAQSIDNGPDDRALAGIAKELRATLTELARLGDTGDDDLGDILSAPLRDEEDAGSGDAGSEAGPDGAAAG